MNSSFFETIKIVDGKALNISYHQKRYEKVLKTLGCSDAVDILDYITPPKNGLYRCRFVYNTKDVSVSYHEYQKRNICSIKIIHDDNIEYSRKSTNRDDIDRLFAKRDNCDEILIVKNSLLTDTSIANIALYESGVWYTPKQPLLEGTTRARLLDDKKIVQRDIYVDELSSFSKVALLNAMVEFDILQKYEFVF